MHKEVPVVLVNGLIGHLDHPALRDRLAPRSVITPSMLGYGHLSTVSPDRIDIPAQVEHLRQVLEESAPGDRVHLLGHSVGAVVAMLYACRYPSTVASVINVEGNFSLRDAFWSSAVAQMSAEEVQSMLAGFRTDVAGWLAGAGIAATSRTMETAASWLEYQPASTLQAMARSVLLETGADSYFSELRSLFSTTPVHLVAGERSREGWDVPGWAMEHAASTTIMPGVGHLMMLEAPQEFVQVILRIVE
ncbi:alpha/beta hydrolase [Pseudomonas entomophila]|uniref:alpha/beta fold hydrolase n=1 Tax=Pseudomonas entomophila TaxID=312306 RepID=UPI0023D87DEF|nr:alpha/beta hydrolase [Pseudomonas entomophila]MDF0729222.1 alpha/beta hydrolase [Pseudomonas entomophila]